MNTENINQRLLELSAMIGSEAATELFNQEYESLHHDIAALPGPRYDLAFRLRRLGYLQQGYLTNEWLKHNRENAMMQPYDHRTVQ
jgi:hypothetical protein